MTGPAQTDLYQAVITARTPLQYLRAEAAFLHSIDDTSGDADWMSQAADQIERLRVGLRALVRAVEADGQCQGYDPRSVGAAHTWVAIAMVEADALLSVIGANHE